MTVEQAKALLVKAQNKEPLTAQEKSQLRLAFEIVAKSSFQRPV